jgi:uncharacterized protein HemX
MTKKEESPAPPPAVDSHKLLQDLERILKNHSTPAEQEKGGTPSWLGWLIVIGVVLAGVAVWSWISWKRSKELADLRHEAEKTRILKEQAETSAKLAIHEDTIKRLEQTRIELEETERRIQADIRAEESRYEADLRAIDSIRNWRDVGGTSG